MFNMFFGDFEESYHIPFNPKWDDGTGYLSKICKDKSLLDYVENFDQENFLSAQDSKWRRVLINVTPFGNAVVFERYKNNSESFAMCVPKAMHHLGLTTSCVNEGSYVVFSNLNKSISELEKIFKKTK